MNQDTPTPSNKKKSRHKLVSIVVSGFLAVAIGLCLFVLIQVVSKGYASLGGYSFFKIITGSMEPELAVGDLILTAETDPDEILVGDIVNFRSNSYGRGNMFITHRVVSIENTPDGTVYLWTKGDANLAADPVPVTAETLIGKVIWKSSDSMFAGLVSFLSEKYGFLVCIAFPVMVLSVWLLRESVRSMQRDIQKLVKTMETSKQEQTEAAPESTDSEEYQQLCAKIRAELIEELKHSDEPNQEGQE